MAILALIHKLNPDFVDLEAVKFYFLLMFLKQAFFKKTVFKQLLKKLKGT